jgi:hypothetical protein
MNLLDNYHGVDFAFGNVMLLPLLQRKMESYTVLDFSEEFFEDA